VAEIRRSPAARSARRSREMAYSPPPGSVSGLGRLLNATGGATRRRRGRLATGARAPATGAACSEQRASVGLGGVLEEAPKALAGEGIEGEVEFHGGRHGGRRRSKEQWGGAHTSGETSGARF
jgi:hypothetical protein